ncbi:MAG: hypothetical protein ACK5N8_07360 [Alphaproteobacteria bacterium]
MGNTKIYLDETSETLQLLENKYNFLETKINRKKSLNNICLKKTTDIAKLKKKNVPSAKLEVLLKEYRNYAVGSIVE